VLLTDLLVVGGDPLGVSGSTVLARQVLDHADGSRGVLYVDHGLLVAGCDLDGRVRLGGRCPADEQRYVESFALHLFGIVDHLVQRGRYKAGEPDNVSALLPGGLKYLRRRHHYAEVYDLEVVALQHDTDDVLPDVVYVALDGSHYDRAVRFAGLAFVVLLDERDQVGDGLLHHAGALYDLRQEHLA
jgi:hypothetical protein